MVDKFDFPWVRFLGMQIEELGEAYCVARLEPRPEHLNHNGTVNGPVLFGAAEYAGGAATLAGMMQTVSECYIALKDAQIRYLAAARGDITATAKADPARLATSALAVRDGQSADLLANVELKDSSGKLVTHVQLTMSIRPRRQ